MTKPTTTCPICKKNTDEKYKPFCSEKCANIDLGRWFSGNYRIASSPKTEDEIQELENSLKERLDQNHDIG